MGRDILSMIEERFRSFSKGKQQIATYILNNPNEASFQTAAIIGKAVGISESSVVRFAGDLGFKGFPDFQRELQQVAMKRLQDHLPQKEAKEEPNLRETPAFRDAVGELVQCRRLWILSDSLGCTLFPYCKLWGDLTGESITFLASDQHEVLFRGLSTLAPGDLLLVPALQEAQPILLFAVEQGKRLGARILILTDTDDLAFRKLADVLLPIHKCDGGILPDLAPAMTVLHVLFSEWIRKKKESIAKQTLIYKEIRNAYENRKF